MSTILISQRNYFKIVFELFYVKTKNKIAFEDSECANEVRGRGRLIFNVYCRRAYE